MWLLPQENIVVSFIQARIESGFRREEWLEGAKDAFWAGMKTILYLILRPCASIVL